MSQKPNILLFLPDGMQSEAISDSACITPNIDLVKKKGTHFTRAYTPSPICSPARSSLMTGMLPHNHGVLQVEHCVDYDQSVLRSNYIHWAQNLVKNGYRTGYFGKWHIERSNQLERFGWLKNGSNSNAVIRPGMGDSGESDLISSNLLNNYQTESDGYNPFLHYAITNVNPNNRTFGKITHQAIKYLNQLLNQTNHWALCISFSEPNEPMICNSNSYFKTIDKVKLPINIDDPMKGAPSLYRRAQRVYKHMTKQQWLEARSCYFGLVSEVDMMLGLLLDRLDSAGQLDNTIIIITSDHGRYLGAHGMDFHNIGVFEEIMKIPLIISGPDIKQDIELHARVGLHDLCPTILELSNSNKIDFTDGISFAGLFSGNSVDSEFTSGFAENHGSRYPLMQRILWKDNWKFVFNGFDEDELYDLNKDPYEFENLNSIKKYNEQKVQLMDSIWSEIKKSGDRTLLQTHYMPLRLATVGPNNAVI